MVKQCTNIELIFGSRKEKAARKLVMCKFLSPWAIT
jgi:hypothetical protein